MDFITLDLNTTTESELLECLNKNIATARMYREEIARLKQLSSIVPVQSTDIPEQFEESEKSVQTRHPKDEDFEDEVDYYYDAIHNLPADNIDENLEGLLPSKKHPYYKKLMLRLKAEILRKNKEIKDFIGQERLTAEEAEDFRKEILIEKKKINVINELLAPKEATQVELKAIGQENSLIFVPTLSGRIRVFDELESMPGEYYDELYDLFASIQCGTFKGVKRFKSSNYGGVSEVRGKMLRVVFDRLDKNTYAIITIFAKKFDNTTGYRVSLESAIQTYLAMEDDITKSLNNPEFISLHKEYEAELIRRISPTKERPHVKAKEINNG